MNREDRLSSFSLSLGLGLGFSPCRPRMAGFGPRFAVQICRGHPDSSSVAGGFCVRVSAVAGDAEKADFT